MSDEQDEQYPGGVPAEDKPERFEPGEQIEGEPPDTDQPASEKADEQEPSQQQHHDPDTNEDTASGGAPEP